MKCPQEQTLQRFMRGDLAADEREGFEAHLEACPSCRRAVSAVVAETVSGELGVVLADDALAATVLPPPAGGDAGQESGLASGERVDHFQVVGPLGAGGMGEVYLAEDTQLRRKVALKLIRPQLLFDQASGSRLLREAQTTARFNHPNIVTIHHVGTHAGAPYLALEYLDGETLRRRMERRALTGDELTEMMLALAGALQEAHSHGVLHRDLKPENVMLPGDGRPRVLDFGLSAARAPRGRFDAPISASPLDQTLTTHHHSLSGTPAYMAPEQWRGEACTEATDVWALGVLLYELLVGQRPFVRGDLNSLRTAVLDEQPAPLLPAAAGPAEIRTLCAACLDKRPGRRPSATQVVEALTRLQQAAALAGGLLAYLLVLGGLLFALGGAGMIMAALLNRLDGTSDTLGLSDVVMGLFFGIVPLALGLAGLYLGLLRRPHRVFLMVLGSLVALLGSLITLSALSDILETGPSDDSLALNLLLMGLLGLLPLGLGVVMLVYGIVGAGRRRSAGALAPQPISRVGTAPTVPQRRA